MLTASYLSPEMKELHQQALDADITMFNEIGFDPGIDHMVSMQCFDEVHQNGGKVFLLLYMRNVLGGMGQFWKVLLQDGMQ